MKISKQPFGKLWNREASLYTLENERKMSLRITDYGGIITHWFVPDRNDDPKDIVLGFDSFTDYLAGHPFFGTLVGRFANRINAGRFNLDGASYQLAAQSNGNHLHGGLRGFDKYIWDSRTEQHPESVSLILQHHSPDGDEGYPGALDAEVRYTLYHDNRLAIDYQATADKTTIVNLTNHSYFNLTGNPAEDIAGHSIQIHAQRFVDVNERQIPNGQLSELAGTYLDCRSTQKMADMFAAAPDSVVDHCYVLKDRAGEFCDAAVVEEPSTGIRMTLATDNVGVQFYNGNKLGEQKKIGKRGIPYPKFAGFCLETQCFPDSPNQAGFPSCVLSPGEVYRHKAEFRFDN